MGEFSGEALVSILALVGIVIIIAGLFSGVIERSGFPQVAVFLALGAVLGPAGMGLINISLDTPILRIVSTLGLVLVLFTDAISINVRDLRRYGALPFLVLGPGTLLSAALVALAGWWLLGLPLAAAVVLGAALASTDPVLLRGLLRRDDISSTVRNALRLEGGLNDVVLLPIVLVAMVFMEGKGQSPLDWATLALDLFLLGPIAGVLVGLFGVATLDMVRRKVGIRRDYESLYSLGIAFAAFAAAEAVHGSGFLAAFAAGLTISSLDVELCDCFLEYGETTSELTLLFTFVLFGSSLIWGGFTLLSGALILFAVVALLIRPIAMLPALAKVRLALRDRILLSWFGPRGLSSLLLILLPVFAGIQGSEYLFAICSVVVIFSVVIHGASPMVLVKHRKRKAASLSGAGDSPDQLITQSSAPVEDAQLVASDPVESEASSQPAVPEPVPSAQETPADNQPVVAGQETLTGNGHGVSSQWQDGHVQPTPEHASATVEHRVPVLGNGLPHVIQPISPMRITLDALRKLWEKHEQVFLLDVRTLRSYDASDHIASGSLRVLPDQAVKRVEELQLPRDAWLIAYCA